MKNGSGKMDTNYDFYVKNVSFCVNRKCTDGWRMSAGVGQNVVACSLGGKGEYTVRGENISTGENDVFFFQVGVARTAVSDDLNPWHFISIGFDACCFDGSPYSFEGKIPVVTRNANSRLVGLFKDVDKNWAYNSKFRMPVSRTLVQNILCQLISINDANSYNPAHLEKIEAAKAYINSNFMRPISVEELASYVELSPSHFRKVFREIVGVSATQYAINLRINKAKDLLLSGSVNVSEAAFQAGFKDVYYFSAMFKKVTGENPSNYLK